MGEQGRVRERGHVRVYVCVRKSGGGVYKR